MKRDKTSTSILKVKPSALKQDITELFEILGFMKQQQFKDGWLSLGDGGYRRKTNWIGVYMTYKIQKGRSLKQFHSIENLWCIVTMSNKSKTSILPLLQFLHSNGYDACCRRINNSYYIIRRFLPEELNDPIFLQVYGEEISPNDNNYIFTTVKSIKTQR